MKFNVEVEIDWIDEEGNLDAVVNDQLIDGLARQIELKFAKNISDEISNTAKKYIQAKTELVINSVLEKPITINESWNNKKEYESIFSMIEEKMTELYKDKIGSKGSCKEDPLLTNLKKYIDTSVTKMIRDMEKLIKSKADNIAKQTLKESDLYKAIERLGIYGEN